MEISIKIDWADLDLYGHVNNVAFYKFMQSARIAFCDSVGLSVLNEPNKLSFILAASECNYKKKLFYPGQITVESKVTTINNTSFHLEHNIYNQAGELAAHGTDILVVYDYIHQRKTAIPPKMREIMEAQMNGKG
ncbi:MAG: acyl-CoA thioesterase [Bacteroidia bacterium]|nr:acyl-CoA thioesterase [Bacteroidia bacterium]